MLDSESDTCIDDLEYLNAEITSQERTDAIAFQRNMKESTGMDAISNEMLKDLKKCFS